MVAKIYGVHGSDTKERKWDLIVGSFAGGWVGVHFFVLVLDYMSTLLPVTSFVVCRTAEQKALHVGSFTTMQGYHGCANGSPSTHVSKTAVSRMSDGSKTPQF